VSTAAAQQVDAELDRLADEYLSVCYPVDLTDIDFSGYGAVAESLTGEGMERAAEVRSHVIETLDQATFPASSLVARDQLREWVSSERDLMESGEKYRQLFQAEAPHHRIVQAIRATLSSKPVDWNAVGEGLEAVADCLRHLPESLQLGMDRGLVATRRQAELALGRYAAMSGDASIWLGTPMSLDAGVSLSHERRVLSALNDVSASACGLTEFLEQKYMAQTTAEVGMGRDRYELWSRKLLGEAVDLDELYTAMWSELAEARSELTFVAAKISSGLPTRDLIWQLDSAADGEVDVNQGLFAWFLEHAGSEATRAQESLVALPPGATEVGFVDGGRDVADVMEVIPPSIHGDRNGLVLLRTLGNLRLWKWPLTPLLQLQVFPGEHLFNCFLVDDRTQLRNFQRRLVSPVAISGWMRYAMTLSSYEMPRDDDLRQLNALRNRIRQLVSALGELGVNLGLPIPSDAPSLAGEQWTEELHAQAIAQWGHQQREFAKPRVTQSAMNPGYALAPIVGSRLRDESLSEARDKAGSAFDMRIYHDRALRLAPSGAPGLRSQLKAVVDSM
jgi:uncharacterized protein (DUF885 family)